MRDGLRSPRPALRSLLVSIFTNEELCRFLRGRSATHDVVVDLPSTSVAHITYIEAAIDLLERRGLLDEHFFVDVGDAVPGRRNDVDRFLQQWKGAVAPCETHSGHAEREPAKRRRWSVGIVSVAAAAAAAAAVLWGVYLTLDGRSAPVPSNSAPSPALLSAEVVEGASTQVGETVKRSTDGAHEQAAREAKDAYMNAISAYDRGDLETYYSSFTEPMECFYDKADALIRHERQGGKQILAVEKLDVVRVVGEQAERVALCDHGSYDLRDGEGRRPHAKSIVMVRRDGSWKIAVETTRKARQCHLPHC